MPGKRRVALLIEMSPTYFRVSALEFRLFFGRFDVSHGVLQRQAHGKTPEFP